MRPHTRKLHSARMGAIVPAGLRGVKSGAPVGNAAQPALLFSRYVDVRPLQRKSSMLKTGLRLTFTLGFVLGLILTQQPRANIASAASAAIDTGVTFTVNVKSAYLRAQPSFSAAADYSIFQGQQYAVVGRTADNIWMQLDFAGAASGAPWVFSSYGQLAGYMPGVPVTGDEHNVVISPPSPAAASASAGASSPTTSSSRPSYVFVRYTVTVKSLYGLAAPDFAGQKVVSLFNGQTYQATAQSTNGQWLLLALPGGAQAWVPAATGTTQGAAADLPAQDTLIPTASATPPPGIPASAGPVLPTVSARARAIYRLGLSLGNNPRAFSKIGDCNSVAPYFLAPFDLGEYRLGSTYAYLQPAIDNFSGSFNRDGAAAHVGLNVESLFDPVWADPRLCQDGETPLACEVRIQRPSIAFISLGTNGSWEPNAQYETGMRQILDFLISKGVVPILSTKVDNLEGGDRFNQIVARLAGEYNVPLWDFASAGRALPGDGLADTYHPTWGQPYFDQGTLWAGWQVRNLTALQSLYIVWQAVK